MHKPIPGKPNLLSGKIVHAAYQVHREPGPGLLESVYEAQVLTFLKLTEKRIGSLFDFNVPVLKDGMQRIIL